MIKILAISGSPVVDSSTDLILIKLEESIEQKLTNDYDIKYDFVKLNDLSFKFCQACGEAPEDKFCFFDELDEIYDKIEQCDCFLFGSPIYFDTVSAQAKAFIDRCNCFRPADFNNTDADHQFIKRLKRKRPGAMVLVGGENGWFEGARRTVAGYFKWIEVVNQGMISYSSKDYNSKGTAVEDTDILNEIETLAGKVADEIRKRKIDEFDQGKYYDKRAPEYEQIYFRDNPPRRKEIDDEAGRVRSLVNDKKVLDLACGTGYWTKIISDTASQITACDLSAEMIKEASKKDFKTVPTFVQCDINELPFDPQSFDIITLGFWFSHHPKQDYQNFFDKLKKLLVPNGKIWLIDNNPPAEGPKNHTVGYDEHGNNFKRRFLDNGEEFVILKNYFSENELKAIFSAKFGLESLIYGEYYWSVVVSQL